ncbi:MAG: copper amine oxidase N-terminal domain-containing protein [Oscillospiraceae bacterium]|nr:copper amine oxidase N-terminal domain-containing protein [Oscillospiraceae bacterium]
MKIIIDSDELTLAIGETIAGMDVPAQIINDRTFVPLRFISEFFGATVEWDEDTQTVIITTN